MFFLCSSLAWFVSNLSNRYTHHAEVGLTFVNPPDSLLLVDVSKKRVRLKLEAVGFRFLSFNLGERSFRLDLSKVKNDRGRYFMVEKECMRQIETQLPNSVSLLGVAEDSLFFGFQKVISKKVPLVPKVDLQLPQNYRLEKPLVLTPDSIGITGPQNEVDTIERVLLDPIRLSEVTEDFSVNARVKDDAKLKYTTYSTTAVQIEGTVSRFSEKMISVPITVINAPENMSVTTFPAETNVLVKASLTALKGLKASDFSVIADYKKVQGTDSKTLKLIIASKPTNIYGATVIKDRTDFILERK
ncbi:CdaR family protein [Maribacter sp. 2-571]|uniref:CdaR family protein n=1 Tax=Maribacter sp. 2-571 TaxID=3417569 RepID=UPI003D326A57